MAADPTQSGSSTRSEEPLFIASGIKGFSRLAELNPALREKFAFKEAVLKRAVPIVFVMRCLGKILADSNGSQATFDLSYPVPFLDGFVSHNWRVPRYRKMHGIATVYNMYIGILTPLPVLLIAIVLVAVDTGVLRIHMWRAPANDMYCVWWNTIVAPPCSWFCMWFFREALHKLGYVGPKLFLDKICIHQTDPDMKRKGIESLGAYLHESQEMCIVASEIYMTSLWTVFELGTLLLIRSADCIKLMPVSLSNALLTCQMMNYISFIVTIPVIIHGGGSGGFESLFFAFLTAVFYLAYQNALRSRQASKKTLFLQATKFQFEQARCSVESDRALVRSMVVRMMKDLGMCEQDDTSPIAIAAFDAYVRKLVPSQVEQCYGGECFPYRTWLFMSLSAVSFYLDVSVVSPIAYRDWQYLVARETVSTKPLLYQRCTAVSCFIWQWVFTLPMKDWVLCLVMNRYVGVGRTCDYIMPVISVVWGAFVHVIQEVFVAAPIKIAALRSEWALVFVWVSGISGHFFYRIISSWTPPCWAIVAKEGEQKDGGDVRPKGTTVEGGTALRDDDIFSI